MKQLNVVEDVLIGAGIAVSLIDLQTILGIVLLVVQLCLILFKGGKRVYDAIKNKDAKEIEDALNDTKEQIESLKDNSQPKDK